MKTLLLCFVFIFASALNIIAQEQDEETEAAQTRLENKEHNMEFGIVPGVSSNLNNGDFGALIGLDFEYKLPEIEPAVGVGALVEFGFFEHIEYVIGFPISVHPFPGVKMFVAPCLSYVDKPNKASLDELHEDWNKRFLLKFGGSYTFEFDRYSISPTLSGDVVGPEFKLNLGVAFAFAF